MEVPSGRTTDVDEADHAAPRGPAPRRRAGAWTGSAPERDAAGGVSTRSRRVSVVIAGLPGLMERTGTTGKAVHRRMPWARMQALTWWVTGVTTAARSATRQVNGGRPLNSSDECGCRSAAR